MTEVPHDDPSAFQAAIELSELSMRSVSVLHYAGIHTFAQLTAMTPDSIIRLPNCSSRAVLKDIEAFLAAHALTLGAA